MTGGNRDDGPVQEPGVTDGRQRSPKVVPLVGMRGMIADKMLKSVTHTAQLTLHGECEISALMRKKARLAHDGANVSLEDLLLQCVAGTLTSHPDLNGIVKEREIHISGSVHLSVAIALPGNLLVAPAIFDAQDKSLGELAAARLDLISRAKTNKLSVREMTGGTFTLSNLGHSRVQFFTPILNAPQIAILGIGRIYERAFSDGGGGIEMRSVIGLSLTFDHRAVDGSPAAAFLTGMCAAIEAIG